MFYIFPHPTFFKTIFEKQPTHKTAHLQVTTHKPMLQLAKEFALANAPKPTHHP